MTPSPRSLTTAELDAYRADGVIRLSGMLDEAWLERIGTAIERLKCTRETNPLPTGISQGGLLIDKFMWKLDDDFRDVAFKSPCAAIAQQLLGAREVHFFYDQLFVKEPGTEVPTPWHQDMTFWPVAGDQILSIWITLDAVDRDSSALEFVRGSHLWPNRYRPIGPVPNAAYTYGGSKLEDPPDVEAKRSEFDILSWDLQRGDMLVFHNLILHGSRGNSSNTTRRRALSVRYAGDDVVYDPRPSTMSLYWDPELAPGERLHGPVFPRLYPSLIPGELAGRDRGPELPRSEPMPAYKAATG
jgi:ectoine hydroxylase-related dioxygenase (phytanoyl-CoA dioxygenase family)